MDHDRFVDLAGELGYRYAGRPSKGKLATAVLERFLSMDPVTARYWLNKARFHPEG